MKSNLESTRTIATSAAAIAFTILSFQSAGAQPPSLPTLTPEQIAARNAAMAKVRAASDSDRKRMMELLGLKDPAPLPPADADPNRRPELVQRQAGPTNNWHDSVGNTNGRSPRANSPNHAEARPGGTPSHGA